MSRRGFREAAMSLLSAFQPVPTEKPTIRPASRTIKQAIARMDAEADSLKAVANQHSPADNIDEALMQLVENLRA